MNDQLAVTRSQSTPSERSVLMVARTREVDRNSTSASSWTIVGPAAGIGRRLGHAPKADFAAGEVAGPRVDDLHAAWPQADYVIVPDASPSIYPDEPEARRAMYVALTRAVHAATIGAVGRFSAIFRSWEAPNACARSQSGASIRP